MNELLIYAALTWTIVGGTCFIGYPSCTVLEVCINETRCLTPTDRAIEVVQVDDEPVLRMTATCSDGSFWVAVPYPAYEG